MTDFELTLLRRLESLECEVAILRATVKDKKPKPAGERIFVSKVAMDFGVSTQTVRRMQYDFAPLYLTHKKTNSGRIYWLKADYDAFVKRKHLIPKKRPKGILRKNYEKS